MKNQANSFTLLSELEILHISLNRTLVKNSLGLMIPPSLNLTVAAKAALVSWMASITDFQPVVCVLWMIAGSRGQLLPDGTEEFEFLGPHWTVGFHNAAKLPADEICDIDGIAFVFDYGKRFPRLNGATLDYLDGSFVVIEYAT